MNNWKKKFIIIWSGQLFSILSSSIAQFAIVLWISLETGSAEVLSFATIAALLPQVVLGPFAGVFVDRWSRKWTMILADSFVALCSSIIALLFYLDTLKDPVAHSAYGFHPCRHHLHPAHQKNPVSAFFS